jgi:rhodanese-related sulfurtransferase
MESTLKNTTIISLDDLGNRIAAGTVQEFWNVLTDQYYSGELIPGSRRVPLDRIGRVAATLSRESEIIVYCTNFDCPQSHMAAEKLTALGFTHVLVYEGGLQEWEESGRLLVVEEGV